MSDYEDRNVEYAVDLMKAGLLEERQIRGGTYLPPGAVPFPERCLARYCTPGATRLLHGVPPIAAIGMPSGWVVSDDSLDDAEEIRVLPFRIPSFSRAYAVRCGSRLYMITRNAQPAELFAGVVCVIQLNEAYAWNAIFGKIMQVSMSSITIRRPDMSEETYDHTMMSFVGKIICWWDDSDNFKVN